MNLLTASSLIASFLCTWCGEKVRDGQKLKISLKLYAEGNLSSDEKEGQWDHIEHVYLNIYEMRWEQGTLIKILTSRILKTEQRLGNSNILLVSVLVSKCVSCIQHIWSVSEVTPHALFLSDLEVIMLLPRCCCKKSLITSDEILPWSPGARTGKTACDCHCQKVQQAIALCNDIPPFFTAKLLYAGRSCKKT